MAHTILVNGAPREVQADGDTPLLWALRDVLGLTGTKFGCGAALCGACTVHVSGEARRSCVTPIEMIGSAEVITIEGLSAHSIGKALQRAWRELDVPQCGYCQSGQLMSAAALLSENRSPSDDDVDAAMSGNICRCGTYGRIRAGVKLAAGYLAKDAEAGTQGRPI